MISKKFGRLTVIEKTDKRASDGSVIYLCQCDCGNLKEVVGYRLKNGHVKSCGCLKKEIIQNNKLNLTDKKFNRLKVISKSYVKNNDSYWLCICDCGNETTVKGSYLKSGAIKSCGCLNTEIRRNSIKDKFGQTDGTSLSSISENRKINKNNTTGVKGVSFDKKRGKYVAQITFKRKTYNLGRFDTLEEAKNARNNGVKKYHKISIK